MDKSTHRTMSKLQSERQRRGWTRKYVAEQLGVSDYTIGQWERGKHMPYPTHIQKLCNLFDASAETLGLTANAEAASLNEEPLEAKAQQARTIYFLALAKRQYRLFSLVGVVIILAIAFIVIKFCDTCADKTWRRLDRSQSYKCDGGGCCTLRCLCLPYKSRRPGH